MERFKDRRLEDTRIKTEDDSVPSTSSGLRNIDNTEGRIRKTDNRTALDAVNSTAGPSGGETSSVEKPKKQKKNNKS